MEKVFFEYDDVKVTNARFINGANTYAMSGITSIKLSHKEPKKTSVFSHIISALIIVAGAYVTFIGIKDGNNLELTHGLNGIRNTAKNIIQTVAGGRKDYKIDCLAADFKGWEISW